MTADAATVSTFSWRRYLAVVGPGLVVMLADTDAGSVITAAQSGAQWGYRLLALQFVLIPILYIVQELTVRLGMVTGKGHAALINEHFGRFWAWFSIGTLFLSCIGALLSEFSGIAGVGALMGVPARRPWPWSWRRCSSWPSPAATSRSSASPFSSAPSSWSSLSSPGSPIRASANSAPALVSMPLGDPKYLYLVSANIGAVIMPWMVFFQQSSVVEKKLKAADMARRGSTPRSARSSPSSSWRRC